MQYKFLYIYLLLGSQLFFCMDRQQNTVVTIASGDEKEIEQLSEMIATYLRTEPDERFQKLLVDILRRPIKGNLYPGLPETRLAILQQFRSGYLSQQSPEFHESFTNFPREAAVPGSFEDWCVPD